MCSLKANFSQNIRPVHMKDLTDFSSFSFAKTKDLILDLIGAILGDRDDPDDAMETSLSIDYDNQWLNCASEIGPDCLLNPLDAIFVPSMTCN